MLIVIQEQLTYGCLCGDNTKPNVTEYSQTLPYFVCRQWGIQCVDNCPPQDTACQSACRADHPCGASNPKRVTSSSAASTATQAPGQSATDDEVVLYTGPSDPDNNNNSGDNGNAAALVQAGSVYGWALMLGSVGVGFALL
jgi:hypothetical protein